MMKHYDLIRLLKMGAMQWSVVVEKNEVWRLVSCMWLHAGVIHIVSNMVSLVFVGIRLEHEFGFGMCLSFLKLQLRIFNYLTWKCEFP